MTKFKNLHVYVCESHAAIRIIEETWKEDTLGISRLSHVRVSNMIDIITAFAPIDISQLTWDTVDITKALDLNPIYAWQRKENVDDLYLGFNVEFKNR